MRSRLVVLALLSHASLLCGQVTNSELHTRVQRFWDSTGAPLAVVQYQFTASRPRSQGGGSNQVDFRMQQMGVAGESRDSTWTQTLESTGGKELVGAIGTIALPLAPWLATWRLVAGERLEEAARKRPEQLQPLPEGGIVVSDLALGITGSPVAWRYGRHRALMSVTGKFSRTDSIYVFYQVLSRSVHNESRTWMTVTNISDPKVGKRVLQLSLPERLERGVNVAERVLDMSRQRRGRYLLELQVSDPRGGGTSVRSAEFEVR